MEQVTIESGVYMPSYLDYQWVVPPRNKLPEPELGEFDLDSCEQCGENAWDGRICHSCGAKNI